MVWVCIFVDDLLVASRHMSHVSWLKEQLLKKYKMSDLGAVERYVGVHIYRDLGKGELYLNQVSYCLETAEKYGLADQSHPSTPLPDNFELFHPWEWEEPGQETPERPANVPDEPVLPLEGQRRFMQLVGSLRYAATLCRPEVAYAVSQLSRVQHVPKARHMAAAERCVRYLAHTADLSLRFCKEAGPELECFVDANLGANPGSKSMTGLVMKLAGGCVDWTAMKQDTVTTSTADSECLSMIEGGRRTVHARDLLADLKLMQKAPTPLLNDNTVAVRLAKDQKSHKRSVHLVRAMDAVRQLTQRGVVAPKHVRTSEQAADFLTKRVTTDVFNACKRMCGMVPLPAKFQL